MDIFEWAEANIITVQNDILTRLSALEKVVSQLPGAGPVNDPSRVENVETVPVTSQVVPQIAPAE